MAGETCLALPKLNLQFLTITDYLLRNFHLFRLEATYEIREDIADVLPRFQVSLCALLSKPVLMQLCEKHAAVLDLSSWVQYKMGEEIADTTAPFPSLPVHPATSCGMHI